MRLRREWWPGDSVELDLPMPVRRVLAHPGVTADTGRAAVERGPLVYCLEGIDNGTRVRNLVLPLDASLESAFRPDLLGGVVVLSGTVRSPGARRPRSVTAIPYFAWANRGPGQMIVWIPYRK